MQKEFIFNIVGIQYRDINLDEVRILLKKFQLILEYEPENKYDSNAIKCTLNDIHVGYVEKIKCELIKNIFNKDYFIDYNIELTNFSPITTVAKIIFEYDENIYNREQELIQKKAELKKKSEESWLTHPEHMTLRKHLEEIEKTITKVPVLISITSNGWIMFLFFPFHIYSVVSFYKIIFNSNFRNDPNTLAYSIPIMFVTFFWVILTMKNDKKKKKFENDIKEKENKKTEVLNLIYKKQQQYINDKERQYGL